MNKDKIIKDLKERNDKLKNQRRQFELRLYHEQHLVEEKDKEIERLNNAMRLKMDKILTFITDFCESCSSHEECPEEECVLWMVEQVVLEEIGKGLEEDGRE